jgi:hypothetical protein
MAEPPIMEKSGIQITIFYVPGREKRSIKSSKD